MIIRFYQLKNGQNFKVAKNTDYAQDLVGKVLERAGDAGNTCLDEDHNVHSVPQMTFVELVKPKATKKKKTPTVVEPEPVKPEVVEEILQEEDKTPIEELLEGEST